MRIVPALAPLAVEADTIQPYPGNPRVWDLDLIAQSLERYGQYKPVVVQRSSGFIVAGNGTYTAATQRLRACQVAAVLVDVDDDTARRMVAVDNRASDLGGYDHQLLTELLSAFDGDLAGTGYGTDDLADLLIDHAAPDLDALAQRYGEPEERSLWPVVRFPVPQETLNRYNALVREHAPEAEAHEQFAALLTLAERDST